jgi:hypothetical protein
MPVPVTRRGHRVDREHLIPRRDQRIDEQAPIGLDPDDHLARLGGMRRGQLMEPGDSFDAFWQPPSRKPPALLILEMHVMMGFRPVHPGKINPGSSRRSHTRTL